MKLAMLLTALSMGIESYAVSPDPVADRIHAYLDRIEADGASAVVLVAIGDEPRVRRGIGHADCDGTEPLTADHLVMIGSITKEFTQLLVYVLVEEGALSFDQPIGRYLTSMPPDKASITVAQLMRHTAGFADLVDSNGRPVPYTVEYDYQPVSREELIRRAELSSLVFAPGEREEYSNLGYNLLGALLEAASGESYEELLASRIFEPAGMARTGYVLPEWQKLRFAAGCRRDGSHWGSPLVDRMWDAGGPSWNLKGAGGLLSTVDDLGRWFGALGSAKLLGAEMNARYLDERLVHSRLFEQRVMGPAGSNGIFNAVAYWTESADLRVALVTTRASYQAEAKDVHREVIRAAADYVVSTPEP